MAIDGLDDDFAPPQKWLDKKQFVRIDPHTGLPQLIRLEPVITEDGEFIPERVKLFIDEEMNVMDREAAENFIDSLNCSPLEITAQWKHRKVNG